MQIKIEEGTGRFLGVVLDGKLDIPVEQNFLYYNGAPGSLVGFRASGAYVFRPEPGEPVTQLTLQNSTTVSGTYMQ
jgi:hypothetical protein